MFVFKFSSAENGFCHRTDGALWTIVWVSRFQGFTVMAQVAAAGSKRIPRGLWVKAKSKCDDAQVPDELCLSP
jgi:hypothetical protein